MCLLLILSNKLDLNQETRFTIIFLSSLKTLHFQNLTVTEEKSFMTLAPGIGYQYEKAHKEREEHLIG